MRKSVCFCLLICMLSVLIGCGGSVPKESTIAVDKKGKITDTIVEEFDKDFYDSEELQGEIESELAEYNKNYATDHITMKKFEVKNGELLDADGTKLSLGDLDGADEAKVLVMETDETVKVEVPGTILAVSAGGNVNVTGKKQAAVADGGLSYIIYK